MCYKKWAFKVDCFAGAGFFNLPEKNLSIDECYTDE